MISRFFIERPIFASVISIVIMIAGAVSQLALPVAKFPDITPPTVQVTCFYPGANAKVVAETVASSIEQEVNGVEGMLYMSSTAADDGSYVLNVTFEIGTDMDMATVLVQNRVSIAEPKLPEEVRRQGVTTKKQSTAILQFIVLSSTDPRIDDLFLSNYAPINIKDELSRIKGVGAVNLFGAEEYSMRVWLDPTKLKARQLTTEDVVNAIREQNVQVAAGRIGEPPAPDDVAFQLVVNTLGRLQDVEQFANLIVKTAAEGRVTRVRDVGARGTRSQKLQPLGQIERPAVGITCRVSVTGRERAGYCRPAAGHDEAAQSSISPGNEILDPVRYDDVRRRFDPRSLQDIGRGRGPGDPGYLFVPSGLAGNFDSVRSDSCFANRHVRIDGGNGILDQHAYAVWHRAGDRHRRRRRDRGRRKHHDQDRTWHEFQGSGHCRDGRDHGTDRRHDLSAACRVCADGLHGRDHRPIVQAVCIDDFRIRCHQRGCALTLSPALCAILLRPAPEKRNFLFRGFNKGFDKFTSAYGGLGGLMVRRVTIALLVFGGLIALTALGFGRLPTGFLPVEDQGYAFLNLQLPDSAALSRTQKVMDRIDEVVANTPGVANRVAISGFSILTGVSGSNNGFMAIVYKPWEERTSPDESQAAIIAHLRREFAKIRDGVAIVFPPPAIDGLGNASGFQLQLQDRGNLGLDQLQAVAQDMVTAGNAQTGLQALNTTFRASMPQLFVDIDRTKVKTLGVPLTTVFNTLQAYLGSTYVNDFNQFGRTYQVRVQADQQYRMNAEAIKSLDVRNANGDMLPMGTFVKIDDTLGPQMVQRYNLYTTAKSTASLLQALVPDKRCRW